MYTNIDLVLHNANVITLDPAQPRAELVAAKGGRIAWVGANDDLGLFSGRKRLIDCHGLTLIPGFNDAHTHLFALASSLLDVDCAPGSVSSIADIQATIRRRAAITPQEKWIKASGYNEFYLAEGCHPTRHHLDQAAPYHPVRLVHRSRHACVLNTLGLRLAGIWRETPDPQGGLIDREPETGEPSGLLFGLNAYLSEKVVPPPAAEELEHGMALANWLYLSSGITSIQEATRTNGIAAWDTIRRLKAEGKLTPRVCLMVGHEALTDLEEQGLMPGCGDSDLRLGMVKLEVDEVRGWLNPPQEELSHQALTAHRAGFQLAIHAIEEGPVEAAVTAIEHCLEQLPRDDHRHRIEHCSVCPPHLLRRLQATAAVVVTQPAFIYYSGERYLATVPTSQLPWLYRIRSFLTSNLRPAAGSDAPVVPPNPLIGIYAAVTRRAETGQPLSPEEAITSEQALSMHTAAAAYASFEDEVKGSIQPGKLADFALLSADPTAVEPGEIKGMHVEKTIVAGEVVWG